MIKIGSPKISPALRELLKGIPKDAQKAGRHGFLSSMYHTLQDEGYPPENYVTRKQAYGQTFQSDKQRRWFFANLAGGGIDVPYRRTYGLREAWQMKEGARQDYLFNDSPAAKWTIGDSQSSHEKYVGWKHWTYTAGKGLNQALKSATDAINDWFRSRPWVKRK